MPPDDQARGTNAARLMAEGQRVLTTCNACRYCEQFCPVFPAIERRRTFEKTDLVYLANLCHNCGECLYACQYAPPHEFGINVPRILSEIRGHSYEDYCWPRFLGVAFRRHSLLTGLGIVAGLIATMFAFMMMAGSATLWQQDASGDFYAVVPHGVMVGFFGGVSLFIIAALWIGCSRCWRDMNFRLKPEATNGRSDTSRNVASGFRNVASGLRNVASGLRNVASGFSRKVSSRTRANVSWPSAIRDALTLRHLHGSGVDCPSHEDTRTRWRRWFHHCTFYGFALCFASTSVAAVYHSVLGWQAPYAYASLPVILGTVGGLGLLVGPAGLAVLRRRRDSALGDAAQRGMDESFLALLLLTSFTGLVLLVLRHQQSMGALLIVHLGSVLALFLTLPYGKFVHGLYRALALVKHHQESQ